MPKTQINLEGWQDYRGNAAGSLLYVETSHQSEMPVRDQLNENGKGFLYEPNYETSTYGLMSCYNVKAINAILKAKSRYILFGTRYEGLSDSELRNKYLIMGYMRIDKIKDVPATSSATWPTRNLKNRNACRWNTTGLSMARCALCP